MDYLALFLSGKALHAVIRPKRLAAAAGLGALYALAAVLLTNNVSSAVIGAAAGAVCAFGMTALAFGGTMTAVLRHTLTFGAFSVGLGGLMTALCGLYRFPDGAERSSGTLSPLAFAAAAAVSGAVSLGYGCFRSREGSCQEAEVTVRLGGAERTLCCMIDSGNLLREPISGRPVIVTSKRALAGMLPEKFPENAGNVRLRAIPVHAVTGSALLYGFLPDLLLVNGEETDAVIAVREGEGDFNGYDGIVPVVLVKKGRKAE